MNLVKNRRFEIVRVGGRCTFVLHRHRFFVRWDEWRLEIRSPFSDSVAMKRSIIPRAEWSPWTNGFYGRWIYASHYHPTKKYQTWKS